MKVWLDADNGPHVLIMRPLAAELSRRGHEVRFTARDRASTCELLDLYGLDYVKVGGLYPSGMAGKVMGTFGRAASLVRAMRSWGADVSFGHSSRSLPLASRLMGIPTLTMYDYEWVNPTLFNRCCRRILLPRPITSERCVEAGIRSDLVRSYDGLKEELYLARAELDATVAADLGLRDDTVKVLLRPPATAAHYHNPESEGLLAALLNELLPRDDVQLVVLLRSPDQRAMITTDGPQAAEIIVPDRVYDGPSMIAAMDMVISGGGTMTREAAVLGVPSYSYFRGREGEVDAWLEGEGRLAMLRGVEDVEQKLQIVPRNPADGYRFNENLPAQICDEIESVAR